MGKDGNIGIDVSARSVSVPLVPLNALDVRVHTFSTCVLVGLGSLSNLSLATLTTTWHCMHLPAPPSSSPLISALMCRPDVLCFETCSASASDCIG
jgi:hypothetical protein